MIATNHSSLKPHTNVGSPYRLECNFKYEKKSILIGTVDSCFAVLPPLGRFPKRIRACSSVSSSGVVGAIVVITVVGPGVVITVVVLNMAGGRVVSTRAGKGSVVALPPVSSVVLFTALDSVVLFTSGGKGSTVVSAVLVVVCKVGGPVVDSTVVGTAVISRRGGKGSVVVF